VIIRQYVHFIQRCINLPSKKKNPTVIYVTHAIEYSFFSFFLRLILQYYVMIIIIFSRNIQVHLGFSSEYWSKADCDKRQTIIMYVVCFYFNSYNEGKNVTRCKVSFYQYQYSTKKCIVLQSFRYFFLFFDNRRKETCI
jgi:hypothetical protein